MVLRLLVGATLLLYGIQKLVNGPQQFVDYVDTLNIPAPPMSGWLIIAGELGLGLALLLGIFTRIAAGLAVLMFFSIWLATFAGQPLFTEAAGITGEKPIFYGITALALVLLGGGAGAVEGLWRRNRRSDQVPTGRRAANAEFDA